MAAKSIFIKNDGTESWEQALNILTQGTQNRAALATIASHFSTNCDSPEKISPRVIKWLANSLSEIAYGGDPYRLLGLKNKVGRTKDTTVLVSKISAYVELKIRSGNNKTNSVLAAATHFHKTPRQIERLLTGPIRFDGFKELSDDIVKAISEIGIEIDILGDINSP